MRHWASGRIFILVLIQATLAVAQQTSSGGTSSGGTSSGGTSGGTAGGRTTTTPTNTNTNPTTNSSNTNTTPSNAAPHPIFLSGRVLTQDGSVPPERAAIERVCTGSTTREAYTDSQGYFSFQVGASNGIFNDASTEAPMFSTSPNGASSNTGFGGNSQNAANALWGCELRASLSGYHSETLPLANRRSMDSPEVGTIYITRMMKVDGYTTSATLALAPKDARKAYEKGLNFSKHSKPDEAQTEFLRAVTVYPKLAAAWFELGKVYELRNHLDEARDAYQKATVADANYVNPYERLYMLALRDTRWKEAADLTDKVIRLNPYEFTDAYYANAVANFQLRNWDAAEKTARESADLKGTKSSPKSLYLLGMILANKGDFTGSAQTLRSYLKTDPLAADRTKAEKVLTQIEQQLQAKQQAPVGRSKVVQSSGSVMRLAILLSAALCYAGDPLASDVQRKFDQISAHQFKRGSVVVFSTAELNAWARMKVAESFPEGLRSPSLELGRGEATGSALVDFLKLRHGQGKDTGWLISRMIEGERPLKVWVRVTSTAGTATVFLSRVDLSGATLSGRTLDFLIDNFFRPRYPEAMIGEPFELEESIDHVDIQPTGVYITLKK